MKAHDKGRVFIAIATLWIGLMLTALLSSCPSSAAQADLQAIAQGRELYQTLACDRCHGLDAVGSTRTYAPTHNHLRMVAEERIQAPNYAGKAQSAADYIRESIVEPKVYVVDGYEHLRFGMPSYAYLSEREVNALVQFLYHQE